MSLAAMPRLVLSLTFGQPAPPPGSDPSAALKACDQFVSEKKPATAITCYDEILRQYPGTSEAHDAERALALLHALPEKPAPAPTLQTGRPAPGTENFYVVEPYSVRTKERLRLTTWEKLDFGITSFLYGLINGASFGAAANSDNIIGPMVVGSLVYTGIGVAYVNKDGVDRGDLPLALAITSYVPATTTLVSLAVGTEGRTAATLVTTTGLLAIPAAYLATSAYDLDPGDTQLVRDCGFWGLLWGLSISLSTQNPSNRSVGLAGLVGLYGGLGVGLLAASQTDISLERVRVTTWGGYGGAVLGVLLAAADDSSERGVFTHFAGGSFLGVLVTFLSTSSIDAPPVNARFDGAPVSLRYLEPGLLPVVDRAGRTRFEPGLTVLRGRF